MEKIGEWRRKDGAWEDPHKENGDRDRFDRLNRPPVLKKSIKSPWTTVAVTKCQRLAKVKGQGYAACGPQAVQDGYERGLNTKS